MIRTDRISCLLGAAVAVGLPCCTQEPQIPQATTSDRLVTVAVAPALNHSGSQDFDPLRVADLMASELAQILGVQVIPLNRVLAQLEADGKQRIESPGHARRIMDRIGADGIVVFALTEYDPYVPPVVGISAQFYRSYRGSPALDPVAASRAPAFTAAGPFPDAPAAQFQWVFNGSDEAVKQAIQEFTRKRNADGSPYGWRKYLASQEHYLRFCCHVTVRELIQKELTQVAARAERQNEVDPE